MWWTRQKNVNGGGRDTIFYAESPDMIHWHTVQEVMTASDIYIGDGINDCSLERFHVARPAVVRVGRTYYMFYESPMTEQHGEKDNQIFLATSSDGVTWRKHPGEKDNQIFLATSSDGVTWRKHPEPDNPQPLIKLRRSTCDVKCNYGIGQPSVFYREGQFWIYFTEATDTSDHVRQPNRIRRIILAQQQVANHQSVYWDDLAVGNTFVAYGSAIDVKWCPPLGRYVMLYSALNDLATPDTYNICVYTSLDGLNWQPPDEILFHCCKSDSENCITGVGMAQPRTRCFPSIVTGPEGDAGVNGKTLLVMFTEGEMHAPHADWRQKANTWDLRFGLVSLDANPLQLHSGLNATAPDSASIYHVRTGYRDLYPNWNCFVEHNPGHLSWVRVPERLMNSLEMGSSLCPSTSE
jgi:hypothetical protein